MNAAVVLNEEYYLLRNEVRVLKYNRHTRSRDGETITHRCKQHYYLACNDYLRSDGYLEVRAVLSMSINNLVAINKRFIYSVLYYG